MLCLGPLRVIFFVKPGSFLLLLYNDIPYYQFDQSFQAKIEIPERLNFESIYLSLHRRLRECRL
jgi:hypothetical protein